MATIGKLCLALTVLGLGVISVWLLPAVGKLQNDVGLRLQKTQADLKTAEDSYARARAEFSTDSHRLTRLQVGWDKSWDIEQNGNTGVLIQGVNLAVTGLGTETGLVERESDSGDPEPPSVYAFKATEEGMAYIGEFRTKVIDANSTTLVPTWQPTQEEVEFWLTGETLPWRFRTQIPAAPRLRLDRLDLQLQLLAEKYAELEQNVARQEALLEDAQRQLDQRNRELVGDPDAEATPGRPEFSRGLTAVITESEDERNALLVTIDELRHRILSETERRQQLLRELAALVERLPSSEDPQEARTTEQNLR